MEIPVYLFTGFLESGKTTFLQEALEGSDFNAGERTLLLLCEEGEEAYEPSRFFKNNVYIEQVEDEGQLDREYLSMLRDKHKAERVVVEYNGMWNLDTFYQNMPDEWVTYQEMFFADASTFLTYNENMRQLVFDKLQSAELVVFNRCEKDFDKMTFHKIVRVANKKSEILYEYGKDDVEIDDIVDPLPFDLEAELVEITDDAYAEWYRDINDDQEKYQGKSVKVKGRTVVGGGLPDDKFVFGRHLMTCCVEDIQFAGLVCKWTSEAAKLEHGGWYTIFAEIKVEQDPVYGEVGPVLYCTKVEKASEARPEVAQF
ncbi:G3E family GTPase [Clostridiales Family XIII bacterium PM5-7]